MKFKKWVTSFFTKHTSSQSFPTSRHNTQFSSLGPAPSSPFISYSTQPQTYPLSTKSSQSTLERHYFYSHTHQTTLLSTLQSTSNSTWLMHGVSRQESRHSRARAHSSSPSSQTHHREYNAPSQKYTRQDFCFRQLLYTVFTYHDFPCVLKNVKYNPYVFQQNLNAYDHLESVFLFSTFFAV